MSHVLGVRSLRGKAGTGGPWKLSEESLTFVTWEKEQTPGIDLRKGAVGGKTGQGTRAAILNL